MPGKSKAQIAMEKRKANLDRRTRKNVKNSVDRPQQKQKPKKKSIVKKIKEKIFGSGGKAKAAESKKKVKPEIKKKPRMDSREANKKAAGVTEKMPRAKDSQVMKAEKARRERAKAKAAKKKERDARADARDAKRGGFISANAMKSSAKKANKAQADRKKKRDEELLSRGRK